MEQKYQNNSGQSSDLFGFRESGTFGVLLALYWTATTLPYYIRGVIVRLLGDGVTDYIIPFFYIVATLFCLRTIIKSTRIWDYFIVIALSIYFLNSYFWFPANATFMKEYESQFLYWCLPFYFVGITTFFSKCKRLLYVFSILAIFFQLLSLFSGGVKMSDGGEMEDMGRAFGILPPVLFMIWQAVEYKSLLSQIIAVIGFLVVLFMGARGPLLVVVEFVALYVLFFYEFKHPVGGRVIVVLLAIAGFSLIESSGVLLMGLSSSLGFSTRILDFINKSGSASEMMLDSSGRDIIYENLIDAIGKAPFWGYGPGADHIYSNYYEVYAHNIVLEMLIEYGLIPGSIILLSILILILFAIKKSNDHDTKVFVLICVCSGFLGLMTNRVYWTSSEFFFMIGICVAVIRNGKTLCSKTK